MSLNTRVALALVVSLLLAPLWVPVLPVALVWLWRERKAARATGLAVLPRFLARSVAAYAEATFPVAPEGGWSTVSRHVDAYLAAVHSPRSWRTSVMLAILEFSPCLRLRAPFSHLRLDDRRMWVAERLSTTRGLFAVPSLVRQLVRMGYYADASVARATGFLPMRQRVRGLPSRARTEAYAALARQRIAG